MTEPRFPGDCRTCDGTGEVIDEHGRRAICLDCPRARHPSAWRRFIDRLCGDDEPDARHGMGGSW